MNRQYRADRSHSQVGKKHKGKDENKEIELCRRRRQGKVDFNFVQACINTAEILKPNVWHREKGEYQNEKTRARHKS